MESCEGSWSVLRPKTSTAITDSLSWLWLPSRCRSARNRRNRLIRSLRRNPGLARTRSNSWRAPSGSVGAMGTAPSIHLVFSDVQMYETYFQRVGTCFFFPLGASLKPDWAAKRDPKRGAVRIGINGFFRRRSHSGGGLRTGGYTTEASKIIAGRALNFCANSGGWIRKLTKFEKL
jgi:hypothetical protein